MGLIKLYTNHLKERQGNTFVFPLPINFCFHDVGIKGAINDLDEEELAQQLRKIHFTTSSSNSRYLAGLYLGISGLTNLKKIELILEENATNHGDLFEYTGSLIEKCGFKKESLTDKWIGPIESLEIITKLAIIYGDIKPTEIRIISDPKVRVKLVRNSSRTDYKLTHTHTIKGKPEFQQYLSELDKILFYSPKE